MRSIIEEIRKIRTSDTFVIDRSNSNRYCVLLQEDNGGKTGYYYSTPIYNEHTRKLVDFYWESGNGNFYASRSNANVIVNEQIRLENASGGCIIEGLVDSVTKITDEVLKSETGKISLTMNGFVYQAKCDDDGEIYFEINVDQPFLNVRSNNKYFALMKERFQPFVTVSCIGMINEKGEIVGPALLSYQKIHAKKYSVRIKSVERAKGEFLFEINLYEPKLLQDTTVESLNPKMNNAFGGTAFLGETEQFGEQWLYTRPDLAKHAELLDRRINSLILHIPKYNCKDVQLAAYKIVARFCSFGSNWGNKVEDISTISTTDSREDYYSLDLTGLMTDKKTNKLIRTNGVVIRTETRKGEFSVIATGDNYYTPQIFEINYGR